MKFGVNKKGFTTIEVLLALSVGFLCISLCYPCLQLVCFCQSNRVEEMEEMIGIEQLRMYLACGRIKEVNENVLLYQGKQEYTLSIVNNQLTLQPGTLVFITDVQDLSFYQQDEYVFMRYKKGKQTYDMWIGFQ